MTLELAKSLDNVLRGCIDNNGCFTIENTDFHNDTLGDILSRDEYGEYCGDNIFRILPQGIDFIELMGGYEKRFLEQNEIYLLEKKNLVLQNKELEYKARIRRQEAIIRMWQIISSILGLTSLTLSFFKLFHT